MFKLKLSKTMMDVQWSFISLASTSLSHLLLRIVLGRELGPSGLGVYTLVFTIYLLGVRFAGFGIGSALTKYLAEFSDDLSKTKEYISTGLIGSVIIGTMIGIFLYLAAEVISVKIFNISAMTDFLKVTALCFPFIAIHKAVIGVLNGFRSMKAYTLLNVGLNASIFLLSVYMVMFLHMGVFGAILGLIAPTILIGFLSLIFVRSEITLPDRFLLQNETFRNVLHFGFYVVLTTSLAYLYTNIDSLMLGYYMTETDVGLYSIAIIFTQGVTMIPNAVQTINAPVISKYYANKKYEYIIKLVRSVVVKMLCISVLISLFFIVYGKTLIAVIFGDEFLPAYYPLIILLIGYTINSTHYSLASFFSSVGYVKVAFIIALISLILNLVLDILLIPPYGLMGAAIATTVSLIMMTLSKFGLMIIFISRGWTFK